MASPRPRPPSGEQFQISFAGQRATITEVGGTLREYLAGERSIVEGFELDEICSGARGQVLAPWPNRVRDGAYEFGGRHLQLALSEPERRHAIHGLVRWVPWRPLERSPERVRLGCTIHPQPGYPFTVDLGVAYSLGAEGLLVSVVARNSGVEPAPFGVGHHPYLRPATGELGQARLRVPADRRLEVDAQMIPTGVALPVAGTPIDFREERPVGEAVLDTCFTGFDRRWVEVDGVRLWWDPSYSFVQVFTGDTLSPDRRRRGLAVEPMSCPPDAFNSGTGLVVLEAGEAWSGAWGITPPAR